MRFEHEFIILPMIIERFKGEKSNGSRSQSLGPSFGRKPLTNLKVSLAYAFTRAFMSILNPYAQT